jgi:hypothetical protein
MASRGSLTLADARLHAALSPARPLAESFRRPLIGSIGREWLRGSRLAGQGRLY